MKPTIGITCAASYETWGHARSASYYYVGREYADAIYQAGGLPLLLPPCIDTAKAEDILRLLTQLDGMLFSGGGDAKRALGTSIPSLKEQQPVRYTSECDWMRAAHDLNMPVLGICRGFQMMVECFGGSISENTLLTHRQTAPDHVPWHKVIITKGSKLANIVTADYWAVNSIHIQQAKTIPMRFIVSAVADDGVIEGIEAIDRNCFMGLQFHPELLLDAHAKMLLKYFIAEAKRYSINR